MIRHLSATLLLAPVVLAQQPQHPSQPALPAPNGGGVVLGYLNEGVTLPAGAAWEEQIAVHVEPIDRVTHIDLQVDAHPGELMLLFVHCGPAETAGETPAVAAWNDYWSFAGTPPVRTGADLDASLQGVQAAGFGPVTLDGDPTEALFIDPARIAAQVEEVLNGSDPVAKTFPTGYGSVQGGSGSSNFLQFDANGLTPDVSDPGDERTALFESAKTIGPVDLMRVDTLGRRWLHQITHAEGYELPSATIDAAIDWFAQEMGFDIELQAVTVNITDPMAPKVRLRRRVPLRRRSLKADDLDPLFVLFDNETPTISLDGALGHMVIPLSLPGPIPYVHPARRGDILRVHMLPGSYPSNLADLQGVLLTGSDIVFLRTKRLLTSYMGEDVIEFDLTIPEVDPDNLGAFDSGILYLTGYSGQMYSPIYGRPTNDSSTVNVLTILRVD